MFFFNARNNEIKFIKDYGSMILEAKGLAKQEGTELKTLNKCFKDYQ